MRKRVTVHEALKKAHVYKIRPTVPLTIQCDSWAQCEIRAYHQQLFKKSTKGSQKNSRYVSGYIFIFPIGVHGNVGKKPLRILHTSKMTLKSFATYARSFTETDGPRLKKVLQKFVA